jgi:hypothetical protein
MPNFSMYEISGFVRPTGDDLVQISSLCAPHQPCGAISFGLRHLIDLNKNFMFASGWRGIRDCGSMAGVWGSA